MATAHEKKEFYIAQYQKKGKDSFLAGDYEQAVRFYTKGFNLDSSDHMWLSNRSAAHLKLGNFYEAEDDAIACIKLNPKYSKGYGRLGHALMHQNKFEEAKRQFQKGISMEILKNETFCANGLEALEELIKSKKEKLDRNAEQDKQESFTAQVAPEAAPLALASEEGEICSLCGLCGHTALNCTSKKLSTAGSVAYEYCNHCNKLGHNSQYCPMRGRQDNLLKRSRDRFHRKTTVMQCNYCNSLEHASNACPNKHLFRR